MAPVRRGPAATRAGSTSSRRRCGRCMARSWWLVNCQPYADKRGDVFSDYRGRIGFRGNFGPSPLPRSSAEAGSSTQICLRTLKRVSPGGGRATVAGWICGKRIAVELGTCGEPIAAGPMVTASYGGRCEHAKNRGRAVDGRAVMDSAALRAVQQPLKDAYRKNPDEAVVTLRAHGQLDEQAISCSVATGRALAVAGLHPATGGDGSLACSGDMLLQALVACAGVTLRAVATSLQIELAGGTITAEGDLDFRGTLAVSKEAAVGFTAVRLSFDLDTGASAEQVDTLLRLTERYCVVYQTLAHPPQLAMSAVS